jgi:hypothetical protein
MFFPSISSFNICLIKNLAFLFFKACLAWVDFDIFFKAFSHTLCSCCKVNSFVVVFFLLTFFFSISSFNIYLVKNLASLFFKACLARVDFDIFFKAFSHTLCSCCKVNSFVDVGFN